MENLETKRAYVRMSYTFSFTVVAHTPTPQYHIIPIFKELNIMFLRYIINFLQNLQILISSHGTC